LSGDEDDSRRRLRTTLRTAARERDRPNIPSFHRGETVNFNPYLHDFYKEGFLETYVFKGWLPATPPISRGTKVTAFGSCFAANITRHLSALGFDTSSTRDPDIYISRLGDGLVNVHALAGQFEWALENKQPPSGLWHGSDATQLGFDEKFRLRTRNVFLEAEFFIITLGLSEIWYDEPTNGVFWRAVPKDKFDPTRHKFRVASSAETKAQIARMYELIRKHVPKAKVLFTLSPIPLNATFRPVSCLTANASSKAILRAALDEFLRENEIDLNTQLFYFPSYEFVNELFPVRFRADNRHPFDAIIEIIMKTFEAVYCDTGFTLADAEKQFQDLRAFSFRELEDAAAHTARKSAKLLKRTPKRSLPMRALSALKRRVFPAKPET
jgi:hypothetical protein